MNKAADYPSQIAPKFTIRFPEGLREEISRVAESNHRSMRAEIVARLEDSLKVEQGIKEEQTPYTTDEGLLDAFHRQSPEKQKAILTLLK